METTEAYQEIVDFLVDPNHLEHAFDLVEVIPRALDKLHIQFWERLPDAVEAQLKAADVENWKVSRSEPADALKERWFNLELSPQTATDTSLYVCFWIEQDFRGATGKSPSVNGSAALRYGFGLSKEITVQRKRTLPKQAKELCENVPKEWILYKEQLAAGWIALKDVGHDLRARPEMVELAKGDTLEKEIAGTFMKLFQDKRERAEAANRALIKAKL